MAGGIAGAEEPIGRSGARLAGGGIGLALLAAFSLTFLLGSPPVLYLAGYEFAALASLLALLPTATLLVMLLAAPDALQRVLRRFTRVDLRDGGHVAALVVMTLTLYLAVGMGITGGVYAVEEVYDPGGELVPPPVEGALGAPSGLNLTANLTADGVLLNWSLPTENATGLTGYRLYRGPEGGALSFLRNFSADATNFTDDPTGGAGYTYRLTAESAEGEGAPSPAVSVLVPVDEGAILSAIIENLIVLILPVLFYVSFVHGLGPGGALRALGLRSENVGKAILIGIGVVVAFEILFALAVGLVAQYQELPQNERAMAIGLGISLGGALAIALGAGISEEIFFRGFLQPRIGVWGQAIVFALAHLSYVDVLQVLVTFALALVFGYLYKRTGNLWAPIAGHAAFNFLNLLLIRLADMAA